MSVYWLKQESMTTPRFFCPDRPLLEQGGQLPLPVAHHALRVLRLKVGARIVLFDGQGGEFMTQLTHSERDNAWIAPGTHDPIERESTLNTFLIQGLCTTDKIDWILQKTVELGIHGVAITAMERSVVRLAPERAARRLAHWHQIMVSAAEQCGRNRLPYLGFYHDFHELPAWLPPTEPRWMLDPEGDHPMGGQSRPEPGVTLLIGPEGGLAKQEKHWAQSAGFISVQAGPRVLRTETAGPAILAALQFGFGDWRHQPPHAQQSQPNE